MEACLNDVDQIHIYNVRPAEIHPENSLAFLDTSLIKKKQHLFNIGPSFLRDDKTEHERATTLVHEMTHDSANTVDVAYGDRPCKSLAQREPNRAINNADNYALCAQGASAREEEKREEHKRSRGSDSAEF